MKNILIRLIILTAIGLCQTSCKKYLDVKPDQKLVVPTSIQDLQALLDQPSFNNQKTPSYDEAGGDNYYLRQSVYNRLSTYEKKGYTWEDYGINYPNEWSIIYDAIYYANVALDGLKGIEKNTSNQIDWNNIKGSALVYRSQSFLRAATIYCKAYDESSSNQDYGIVLRQTSDFNVPSLRASVKDTYDKIVLDLKEAAPLLPVTPKHVLRPSKPAAYALLARTYLSMRKYDSAYKYSDLCLQLKSDLMNYAVDLDTNNLFNPVPQFNKEVIFSSSNQIYTYLNIQPGRALVDTNLYNSYSNNDLRRPIFYLDAALFGAGPGYYFQGTYEGSFSRLFKGVATDEVWLIRAECNARLGNKDAALVDLNALMVKRWMNNGTWVPFTASTSQEALYLILTERRKELIFRGLRWMDIKRLNKEDANITLTRVINGQTYTLPPNDLRYALLLPQDIINITGMPQNPR